MKLISRFLCKFKHWDILPDSYLDALALDSSSSSSNSDEEPLLFSSDKKNLKRETQRHRQTYKRRNGINAEKSDDNLLVQFWLEKLMQNSLKTQADLANTMNFLG